MKEPDVWLYPSILQFKAFAGFVNTNVLPGIGNLQ
jgi:hypothetical protein